MWVCSNCETANNSQKRRCAVCDSEKPFSTKNTNSSSLLKNKIQELEAQIFGLDLDLDSLERSNEALASELSTAKHTLTIYQNEKDRLKEEIEKINAEKKSIESKLKKIEVKKSIFSISKESYTNIVLSLLVFILIMVVYSTNTQSDSAKSVKYWQNYSYRVQMEKQKIENKLQSISSEVPFVVTSIDFKNTAEKGDYKKNFNYDKIRYIAIRLKIIPISNNWSGKIFVKYFDPNGTLESNKLSPYRYTFADKVNIHSTQEYIYLSGWGSDRGFTYGEGIYTVQVWCNDKIIGEQIFTVNKRGPGRSE